MQSIRQCWDDFEQRIAAEGALPIHRDDMRIAFYAGFSGCLLAILEIAEQGSESEMVALHLLQKESHQFARSL